MNSKSILIFDKDAKARQVIDIMCRKIGCANVAAADSMKQFNEELTGRVDTASGISVFMGKKALPRLTVDLFIIDWDSPPGGVVEFMGDIKSKYSGKYQFIVVADNRHASFLGTALKAGAYDCLIKPFQLSEFREKLEGALSGKKKMVVQSFNLGAATEDASKKGYGVNPFAAPKEKAITPVVRKGAGKEAEKERKPEKQESAKTAVSPSLGSPGRTSVYRGTAGSAKKSDSPTATLIDGKIDGHYHEKVNIIGGGETCYWAKEIAGDKVRLEYLNAKGEATGMEARIISRDDFMYGFYLCVEHGCNILKQLGKWPPKDS